MSETHPPFPNPTQDFATMDGYRHTFMNTDYWAPYVRWVCRNHNGPASEQIRIGLPGTYPTFIVDDQWVIKFFGTLFDGPEAFEAEHELNRLLQADASIAVPRLLGNGTLFAEGIEWHWPYLIFEFVPGTSVGEAREQITHADKLILAQELAAITRRLHALPVLIGAFFRPSWHDYQQFLARQRKLCVSNHQMWHSLPDHLLQQLDAFLPEIDELVDITVQPYLIHADLTADHILGECTEAGWHTNALIDFGDAMVGNLLYELVALHLDLFGCDKHLLKTYLQAYGVADDFWTGFARRAMAVTLLHRFNVLEVFADSQPGLAAISSLDELARCIWDVEAPGLV